MSSTNSGSTSGPRRSGRARSKVKYYSGKYSVKSVSSEKPEDARASQDVEMLDVFEGFEGVSESDVAFQAPNSVGSKPSLIVTLRISSEVLKALGTTSPEQISAATFLRAAASKSTKEKTPKAARAAQRRQPSCKTKATQEDQAQPRNDQAILEEPTRQEAALALLELSLPAPISHEVAKSAMRDSLEVLPDEDITSAAVVLNGFKQDHKDSLLRSKMTEMLRHYRGEAMDSSSTSNSSSTVKKGIYNPDQSLNLDTDEGFMPSADNDFKFKYDSPSGRTAAELDALLMPPARPKVFPQDLSSSHRMRLSYKKLGDMPPK
jgi:hypothetical protein